MTLTTLTMTRAHDEAMGNEPSMPDRPKRRSFTAEYKLAILDEYDLCSGAATKVRSCAEKACTRVTSSSGAVPETAVRSPASVRKTGR